MLLIAYSFVIGHVRATWTPSISFGPQLPSRDDAETYPAMAQQLQGITATRLEKQILIILAHSFLINEALRNIRETRRRHSPDCSSSRLLNLVHYTILGISSLSVFRAAWRLTSSW